MYIFTYIHIHIYTYTHIYIYTYIHIYIYTCYSRCLQLMWTTDTAAHCFFSHWGHSSRCTVRWVGHIQVSKCHTPARMVLNKENLGAQIEINWWWSTVLLPVQMKSADQLAQKSQLVNVEFGQCNFGSTTNLSSTQLFCRCSKRSSICAIRLE